MNEFLRRFGDKVIGVLHGLDRLRFRGSKRGLCYAQGMLGFLWHMQILLKDFGSYAEALCEGIESRAKEMDLPTIYLASSGESKEKRALANVSAALSKRDRSALWPGPRRGAWIAGLVLAHLVD